MLKPIATLAVAAVLTTAAPAQTTTAPAAGTRTGGLAGLLGGGGLPNIAGVGAGNAAGLLGYCLKNNLLGATGAAGGVLGGLGGLTGRTPAPTATPTPSATAAPMASAAQSILQRLTGRQGVASSPAYAAGQAGQVQAGGQNFSLDSLRGQVKTRVCSLVLNRAKSFL